MRPHLSRLWRRMPVRGDERGAALIYALLFVTVIAIAVAAVLTLADTNLRTTRAMRQQAAQAAAADGAAQVAINALRQGTYAGAGDCFGPSGGGTMELPSFYPQQDGPALSTRVECVYDSNYSEQAAPSLGYALIGLSQPGGNEDTLNLQANNGGPVRIAGDVGANGNIVSVHASLQIDGALDAALCNPLPASLPDANGTDIVVTGTVTCDGSVTVSDPNLDLPPGATPTPAQIVPACPNGTAKITFQPGVYTDRTALNNLWGGSCDAQVFDFRPGIYWFDFSGAWELDEGVTVAGSAAPLPNTAAAIGDLEQACPSPLTTNDPNAGVVFIFGGEARLLITGSAQVALCGKRLYEDQPPIVTYGLKTAVGSVPAQTGCVTLFTGNDSSKCPVIRTITNGSTDIDVYIHGVNYQPLAWIELDIRNSTKLYFRGGVVARRVTMFAPASAEVPTPISSGPGNGAAGQSRTVVYLAVYVCPASSCSSGGSLQLKVKAGFTDANGTPQAGRREVTVYSWSVQR